MFHLFSLYLFHVVSLWVQDLQFKILLPTGIHPTIISESFQKAAQKAIDFITEMSTPVDLSDKDSLLKSASTSLNSKVCFQTVAFKMIIQYDS